MHAKNRPMGDLIGVIVSIWFVLVAKPLKFSMSFGIL